MIKLTVLKMDNVNQMEFFYEDYQLQQFLSSNTDIFEDCAELPDFSNCATVSQIKAVLARVTDSYIEFRVEEVTLKNAVTDYFSYYPLVENKVFQKALHLTAYDEKDMHKTMMQDELFIYDPAEFKEHLAEKDNVTAYEEDIVDNAAVAVIIEEVSAHGYTLGYIHAGGGLK